MIYVTLNNTSGEVPGSMQPVLRDRRRVARSIPEGRDLDGISAALTDVTL
ncbi:hypothetical protein [Paraburkholderia youngii]